MQSTFFGLEDGMNCQNLQVFISVFAPKIFDGETLERRVVPNCCVF
jgi:hypothetical protein